VQNPHAFNRNMEAGVNIVRNLDHSRYNVVSILGERKIRDSTTTTGPGGGTMTQRFTWEEPYDTCKELIAPLAPVYAPGDWSW